MRTLELFVAVILFAAPAIAAEKTVVRAYPLATSDTGPIIEVLDALLGVRGKAVHDRQTGRLIVAAPENMHEQVKDVLKELNAPALNVRLEVVINDVEEEEKSGLGVPGSGRVEVSGTRVRGGGRLKPFAKRQTTTRRSSTRETLLVRSGGEGTISIGREVPYRETILEYGRRWGYIRESMVIQRVGASLRVRPKVIGNGPLISIRVIPEVSVLTDEGSRTVRYTQASTEFTARDGEVFTLGEFGENSEFYRSFLVGVDSGGKERALRISAMPTIVAP